MSPKKVNNLVDVVNKLNYPSEDHINVYSLLSELRYITNHIVLSGRDRTMSYLASHNSLQHDWDLLMHMHTIAQMTQRMPH